MSIKFRCKSCEKVLETKDERAGKSGKCPHCGNRITVPDPAASKKIKPVQQDARGVDEGDGEDYFAGSKPSQPIAKGVVCDVCGANNSAEANRCKSCGESFDGDRQKRKSEENYVSIGEVLSVTKDIYQAEMGLTIGAVVMPLVILAVVVFIGAFVLAFLVVVIGKSTGSATATLISAIILYLIFYLGIYALAVYLTAGEYLILNKVARGKRTNIGDLFSGGPFFWRIVGNGLLIGIVVFLIQVMIGVVAAVGNVGHEVVSVAAPLIGLCLNLPTILIFWTLPYFIIDRDDRGIQSLNSCFTYFKYHWLATVLGGLIMIAVMGLVPVACIFVLSLITKSGIMALMLAFLLIIAAIFVVPFFFLMYAVIFCHATGRHTPV